MGQILRWGLLQLCQSLVNGLYELIVVHVTDYQGSVCVGGGAEKEGTRVKWANQ